MQSLLKPAEAQNYIDRINQLTPQTPAQWGKMNVSQMLAHCCTGLQSVLGDTKEKRILLSYIFGPIGKKEMLGPKPARKNMPTAKSFIKLGQEFDFDTEKKQLLALINRYVTGGEAGITPHPHPFFGKMTAAEWDLLMSKHLDHHLQQFGV